MKRFILLVTILLALTQSVLAVETPKELLMTSVAASEEPDTALLSIFTEEGSSWSFIKAIKVEGSDKVFKSSDSSLMTFIWGNSPLGTYHVVYMKGNKVVHEQIVYLTDHLPDVDITNQ